MRWERRGLPGAAGGTIYQELVTRCELRLLGPNLAGSPVQEAHVRPGAVGRGRILRGNEGNAFTAYQNLSPSSSSGEKENRMGTERGSKERGKCLQRGLDV